MEFELQLPGSSETRNEEYPNLRVGADPAYEMQEACLLSMFSTVQCDPSLESFEQDTQWLAEEWERCKHESAETNGSDTLSCSEFGCIDDLREDEDPIQVSTSIYNNEPTETEHSAISLTDLMIDHDYALEPNNEFEADNFYVNFPNVQQDYYCYGNNSQACETGMENLDVIHEAQTLHITNRGQSDQVDVQSCLEEEQRDDFDIDCRENKQEECVIEDKISVNEDECVDDNEDTISDNELTDDASSQYCDDQPVLTNGLDCGNYEVEFVNIGSINEEQYDNSISQNADCTNEIKVIVIGEELNNDEDVRLHEKEPSNCAQVSFHAKERSDENDKQKQSETEEKNIKDQTTQTCDILFTEKDKSPEDMWVCEYCHKVFANQYKLESHRFRNHSSTRNEFEERFNGRSKSQQTAGNDWPPDIKKMARKVNGKKVFFCNECSYSVNRCDSITKHMYRIHSGGRAVPHSLCEVCGKTFVDRAYLRNHKVSHATERRHSCEVCGKAFHRQPSLKRHLLTHTAERQYSCSLCDYQTNRKHMMYKHVEQHTLGRAHVCHVCHAHLYTKLAYRSHMYEHRVPPNSCSLCKVGFASRERMMSHMRKTHSAYEISVYKKVPKQEPTE